MAHEFLSGLNDKMKSGIKNDLESLDSIPDEKPTFDKSSFAGTNLTFDFIRNDNQLAA